MINVNMCLVTDGLSEITLCNQVLEQPTVWATSFEVALFILFKIKALCAARLTTPKKG